MTRPIPLIFWIILLSFLIRLAFIVLVPPTTISIESDDAGYYHQTALQLRGYFPKGIPLLKELFAGHLFKGGGMLEKYQLEIPWGAVKKGPLYPLFAGLIFWIAGPEPLWVFLAQAFLVSLAGALFYGIARELGQEGAGLLCAFLVGVYPPFIFITQKLLQESLSIFLFALFYFLVFRSQRTNSFWSFGLSGIALFLLALTKSRLFFFPFFLFAALGAAYPGRGRKIFLTRNLVTFFLAFFIPYFLWAAVVSWQLRRPALFLEHGGMEILSGVHPDYNGWTPDSYLAKEPDANVAEVLKREKILDTAEGENRVWPSDSKMIGAGLKILGRHPWISLRMALERLQRLWWRPYDWPWREFLFPPAPLLWFHRVVVVAAITGMVIWGWRRPLAVWFLSLPLLYAIPTHAFFHCEHRYLLPFLPFLFPFASFFIHLLWEQRKVLVRSFQEFVFSGGFVLAGGLIFRLSQTAFVLKFFPSLDAYQAHRVGAGIQSLVLAGFFLVAAFWLKRILPRHHLLASLAAAAFFILIPFESHAFTAGDWRSWKATVRKPTVGIRQEIFLPRGSLGKSVASNLRIDLLPPHKGGAWVIRVNGESIGTLETLKSHPSSFLLAPPYSVYLEDARRQAPHVRQWFSLPIPSLLLKEETVNTIEMVFNKESLAGILPPADQWTLFGDYLVSSPSLQFQGPLFHRSSTEISVFKFLYETDLRLDGITSLHHQGVNSFYHRGGREVNDDLSDSFGIQRGEYRIRIEIEERGGQIWIF